MLAGALGVPLPGSDFMVAKGVSALIAAMAKDIKAAGSGKAVVVAGSRQPAEVHAAVAAINAMLNSPVEYYSEPEDPRGENGWTGHGEQLKAFGEAAKSAKAVLVLGANPVLA